MLVTKHLKIFVTTYHYMIELKPVFGNSGQWLCNMVITRGVEIHLFNVPNSVVLTMEIVRICHVWKLKGKYLKIAAKNKVISRVWISLLITFLLVGKNRCLHLSCHFNIHHLSILFREPMWNSTFLNLEEWPEAHTK